jgi:phosphoribosylformimino-5-aminoimidazole carboxamide ribotide isomerase
MIALPAIDLREGACVQLVGGDYAREAVRVPDPLDQVFRFRDMGFRALHVVDLDAATGRGNNAPAIARIAREAGMRLQVGGGVRSHERAKELFDLGVERIVVGTRALEDTAFRDALVEAHPDRVIIAVDVREREVLTRGWAQGTGRAIGALVDELSPLAIGGLLVTAVHREGALGGIDAPLYRELCAKTSRPIFASGGVTTIDDLAELRQAGCKAAVIGMALYAAGSKLDGRAVAEEYAA